MTCGSLEFGFRYTWLLSNSLGLVTLLGFLCGGALLELLEGGGLLESLGGGALL